MRCDFPISLGFENVAIIQKKNACQSRLDVDISSEVIKGVIRPTPFIASNMSTVCNANFCRQLYQQGALGILHRAALDDVLEEQTRLISRWCEHVAVSVGIGDSQKLLADKLIRAGANIITVDIAHGYCDAVIEMGKWLKRNYTDVKIILGNTTNIDMLHEVKYIADALKVGIAQGFACETKNTAGCTEKQFSAVYKFRELSRELGIPIISDGAIREPADAVKAIGAGANSIMAGSIFARCPESAAITTNIDGYDKKIYAGMASRFVQDKWKGGLKDGTCPEGGIRYLELGEILSKMIERYSGALKSGITYSGGNNIRSFQNIVEFVRIV